MSNSKEDLGKHHFTYGSHPGQEYVAYVDGIEIASGTKEEIEAALLQQGVHQGTTVELETIIMIDSPE